MIFLMYVEEQGRMSRRAGAARCELQAVPGCAKSPSRECEGPSRPLIVQGMGLLPDLKLVEIAARRWL